MLFGIGLEQDDITVFRHNENVVAAKQDLPMSVAALLPLTTAALDVDAGKHAIIKSEDVIVVKNQISELGLHSVRLPKFNGRKFALVKINLKHFTSFAVSKAK